MATQKQIIDWLRSDSLRHIVTLKMINLYGDYFDYCMNAQYQNISPIGCKKLYFSYPMNVALITTKFKNKINIMPASASFECKIPKMIECGDHGLIMDRILNIRFRKNAFNENGILKTGRIKPLLYLGNNQYATTKNTSEKVD